MLGNGIRPHHYCKPILKREEDRQALLEAATSGEPCFFLGTDSAPHGKGAKENACGCAGCFTGLHALELYAEAFDSVGKVHMLPDFAGKFGAEFYGLPRPTREVRLVREEWVVPPETNFIESDSLVPFLAGELLHWKCLSAR
jgi:dihydroorotase